MSSDLDGIAVVIPTYNGRVYLRAVLESIWRQTLLPNEIILVDDASSDGTADYAENICQDSPIRTRVIRLERNSGGPATPMNAGVELASASLIALCDQDDLLPPDRLERHVSAFNKYSGAGLSCGAYTVVDRDGRPTSHRNTSFEAWLLVPFHAIGENLRWIASEDAYRALLRGQGVGGGSSLCFRKQVWQRVGGFDPQFRICWDYDFAMRIAASCDFLYDTKPLCFHRIHENNLSHSHTLCEAEFSRIRWRHYHRPAVAMSPVERSRALAGISADAAYRHREQGWYVSSARAHLSQFVHGERMKALEGLMKLTVFPFVRLFHRSR